MTLDYLWCRRMPTYVIWFEEEYIIDIQKWILVTYINITLVSDYHIEIELKENFVTTFNFLFFI